MTEQISPFIYSNAILGDKKQLIVDEESEKAYNPFLTNRALSQHGDLMAIANKVNEWHFLDKKLQFDYLLNVVPKKKRKYAKWAKRESVSPELTAIMEYYTVNERIARQYERLLTEEQIKFICASLEKGG